MRTHVVFVKCVDSWQAVERLPCRMYTARSSKGIRCASCVIKHKSLVQAVENIEHLDERSEVQAAYVKRFKQVGIKLDLRWLSTAPRKLVDFLIDQERRVRVSC